MFNLSVKLWYNNRAISKKDNRTVSLYLQVYISRPGKYESTELPLHLKWPFDRIDRANNCLLPRHQNDQLTADYNLIIGKEIARINEVGVMFRLASRNLDLKALKYELKHGDRSQSLIKYMELKRSELYNRGEISHQTYKNVGTTINLLKEYQENVMFEELDESWMRKFKAWLKRKNIAKRTNKNPNAFRAMLPGTIWTRIRDLKAYLALASKEVTIKVDESAVNFPNPEPQKKTTYLNKEELRYLMILLSSGRLTDTEVVVLRAFLFTCFTSLRISDLKRANATWLVSDNILQFMQYKNRGRTPKLISIPFIPIAKSLVDDMDSLFFSLPTEQEYNRTLKDLAIKAGINKRLTSHVGRHTFGYLYMTEVGNIFGLKEIMGHSKLATTERYSHLDEDYNLSQVMKLEASFWDIKERFSKTR